MDRLADRITAELSMLIGKPISNCWGVVNMQCFGFGPLQKKTSRMGDEIDVTDISLHIQCRWRFVDEERILFGRDDLLRPVDESISVEDFDWETQLSVLDESQSAWFDLNRSVLPQVTGAVGDRYGGFRLELEGGFALECFPCNSDRGRYSEHWRLFGHRGDDSHFVVKGYGVETAEDDPTDES